MVPWLAIGLREGGGNEPVAARRIDGATARSAPSSGTRGERRVNVRRVDGAARAQLAAAIRRARSRRTQGGHAGSGAERIGTGVAGAPLVGDKIDLEYFAAAMQSILPLVRECYEAGLERDSTLAGRIVVHLSIEGELELGGIVGASGVDAEQTTLQDAQVRECVQETMYALVIDQPPEGVVLEVTYPFSFAHAD